MLLDPLVKPRSVAIVGATDRAGPGRSVVESLGAIGFAGAIQEGLIADSEVKVDSRGSVVADAETYRTNREKVFAAGDMRRGQSLVVWAIREGRQAARAMDEFLMGSTILPR